MNRNPCPALSYPGLKILELIKFSARNTSTGDSDKENALWDKYNNNDLHLLWVQYAPDTVLNAHVIYCTGFPTELPELACVIHFISQMK